MEEVRLGCEVPDAGVVDAAFADAPAPPIVDDGSGVPPTGTGVNPNRANWTATAWPNSSTISGDTTLSNAFDDLPSGAPNLATRWSDGTAMNGDEYFVLDLGQVATLSWITLTSNTGAAVPDSQRAWELQFSSDGTTWTAGPEGIPPGVEGVNGDVNQAAVAVTQIPLPPTSARYIRINQLGSSGSWWSLHDIRVYGQ
jgi:glucosylceramidase